MLARSRVLELIVFKALPLFLGAAVVWFGLIRDRSWRVSHFSSRARTAYYASCLTVAAVAACLVIERFQNEILCPSGYGDPEWQATSTGSGKRGNKIVCHANGRTADGSFFPGLFAFLGSGALVFLVTSAVLRRFGPPVPPESLVPRVPRDLRVPPPLGPGALLSRRERRRRRKREQHDQRQRQR
jgi:hypothetical protein